MCSAASSSIYFTFESSSLIVHGLSGQPEKFSYEENPLAKKSVWDRAYSLLQSTDLLFPLASFVEVVARQSGLARLAPLAQGISTGVGLLDFPFCYCSFRDLIRLDFNRKDWIWQAELKIFNSFISCIDTINRIIEYKISSSVAPNVMEGFKLSYTVAQFCSSAIQLKLDVSNFLKLREWNSQKFEYNDNSSDKTQINALTEHAVQSQWYYFLRAVKGVLEITKYTLSWRFPDKSSSVLGFRFPDKEWSVNQVVGVLEVGIAILRLVDVWWSGAVMKCNPLEPSSGKIVTG